MRTTSSRRVIEGHVRRLRRSRDKGFVIALTALLLLPLVALTGFAVDVGAWYARAEQMQRTADAAALAGVVWIEDANATKYQTVARETAAKNGFVHNPPEMTVTVSKINGNQVQVEIRDLGTQFFSHAFVDDARLTRHATAEYIEPVPMGSPRNFLGMGKLAYSSTPSTSSYIPEGLTLSINGYCTAKNQGDRIAAQRISTENCTGTMNSEYKTPNYEYYVDLPAGRTYATDVLVFDGSYVTGTCSGDNCRTDGDGNHYESGELPPDTAFPFDFNPGGGSQGTMSTRFTLHQADTTPLDDNDNPAMSSISGACATATRSWGGALGAAGSTISPKPDGSKTFAPSTKTGMTNTYFAPSGSGANFYNSPMGWWNLCRIPAGAPSGRYVLKVDNTGNIKNGSNNYGVVAHRVGTTSTALCNSTLDGTCPKVYAKEYLSIRAAVGGGSGVTAQFYLAEVPDEHAGKTLKIQLWDPAEGGQAIRLLKPTGASTWGNVNFNWKDNAGNGQNNVSFVPVTSYNFDGRLLTLEYALPSSYTNPGGNAWWKIEYTFGASPTDRTTWSVGISGDPIHLVE